MNKSTFVFYNRNDKGELVEDCVCRAISTATGLKYSAVQNLLRITADLYQCPHLCVCCYHYLLENILNYKVYFCDYKRTVGEITRQYYNKRLVIRIDGHLTCAIFGKTPDTWDCSKELVDCFWIIE